MKLSMNTVENEAIVKSIFRQENKVIDGDGRFFGNSLMSNSPLLVLKWAA